MVVRLIALPVMFVGTTALGQVALRPPAGQILIEAPPTRTGELPIGIGTPVREVLSIPAEEFPLEQLIDRLVLTEQDHFVNQGVTYLRRESSARIADTARELTQAGKIAWGPLVRHLRDIRPSIATRETTGPHTVGDQCFRALFDQVMSRPHGYPSSKLSPYFDFESSFRGTIGRWLAARQDRSLESLRVEMLEHLIIWEREAAWRGDPDADAESLVLLEAHLAVFRRELDRTPR
jgi:hypothetical protein